MTEKRRNMFENISLNSNYKLLTPHRQKYFYNRRLFLDKLEVFYLKKKNEKPAYHKISNKTGVISGSAEKKQSPRGSLSDFFFSYVLQTAFITIVILLLAKVATVSG